MDLSKRLEAIAALALVAVLTAGCLLVVAPFASAILWAAVICFTTWPLHLRVLRLCGGRQTLAAAITTSLAVIVTVLPFVLAVSVFDTHVSDFVTRMQAIGANGLPPPPDWVVRIPLAGDWLHAYWADLAGNSEKGHIFLRAVLDHARTWLLHRGVDLGVGLMHLCISVFIAFFLYRDGERIVDRVGAIGRHIFGEYSSNLLVVVGRTLRGVVFGIVGTALGQGVMAAIGFAIAGVPLAIPLGMLTLFLSLIPFGAPLVWVGATVWLFAHGSAGWGVFMALWGFLGISGIDNFVRPYLISRGAQMPFVLIFLGAMGGIMAFGLIGLFLGPILLAIGYCLIQEFFRRKNAAAPTP